MYLSEFSFTIEHVPGKENELADNLSRNPVSNEKTSVEPDLERIFVPTVTPVIASEIPHIPTLSALYRSSLFDEVIAAQQGDDLITRNVSRWKAIIENGPQSADEKNFLRGSRFNEHGFWKRDPSDQWRLCVHHAMLQRVLWEYHDAPLSGHPGSDETIRDVKRYFCWPGMNREIRRYVAECHHCICCKPVRGGQTPGLRPRSARRAWEVIAVDLMGPYPRSNNGNRFILIVTNLFPRWVEAFPLRNSDAPRLVNTLEKEVFLAFRVPTALTQR